MGLRRAATFLLVWVLGVLGLVGGVKMVDFGGVGMFHVKHFKWWLVVGDAPWHHTLIWACFT
jgi:hypothetical protein